MLFRPARKTRWFTAFCINSKSAAASHQLSSFFGASVGLGIAVFPRPFCADVFETAVFATGAGLEDDFDDLAVRSGCI
jgi:hypothetical protein